MKKFLPYYRHLLPVKWIFAGGVIAGLIYALASGAGLPLMTKVVFPILFRTEEDKGTSWWQLWLESKLVGVEQNQLLLLTCLWIPLIFLIRALAGYTNSVLINYVGLRVSEGIRTDLFVKLQSLPLSFFKSNRSGDLLARLMSDTELLRQVLAQTSSDLIKQPATLIAAVSVLASQAFTDKRFAPAIIALLSVPLCVTVIRGIGKKLARRARQLQYKGGDLTATLSESLQAPLEIRAYNLQQRQTSIFRDKVRKMLGLSMKVVRYRQAISPSIEVVAAAGFAFALYFGVKSGMTLKDFTFLGMTLYMAYEPVKKLGMIHSLFKQGEAAVERIEHILHEPDRLPESPSPSRLGRPRQSIRFEDVSFAYKEERVLSHIDVEVPIGQVVALVGPSGAGKSTFAHLVPRFYDPVEGRITLDGVDIREYAKKDLRSQIAVVPQMPALFSGTIAENIRVGRLDATDEEVMEAAKKAFAHDFIVAQEHGYQAEVGERGELVSGGQRQRIAIARAFLRDAPILILDEATSALDSESEHKVQQALAELVKGRATFIIAHRFSTITIADRILVFQKGRIVADGSHENLLQADDPTYRSMINSQLMVDAV
ncbi:ABC transporter ATP-binding protein [Luteolibacter sp. SL250]|uniref:ABC transporter ATP-binding protein n=1 Tax=Luteolibacter sp. SL250 TaxID=2995170 RepID=UPI00226D45AC|nr:ABC transporter ATP-binding protein [Luteolibacter sp. SL250]WAC19686.1 ABC transporter ATP-binding protein [Luteolibacter sp. SL250]